MSDNRIKGNEVFTLVVLLAIAACILFGMTGCVQHIGDVTVKEKLRPDGSVKWRKGTVHGGHTAVAADSEIGLADFTTPSGWGFTLSDFSQYLDSLEFEIDPITKKIKLKTSGEK